MNLTRLIMLAVIAVPARCLAQDASGDSAPSWHLLTQTYGGTVSLVKSLTKHECEFMKARALGEPATPEEISAQKKQRDAFYLKATDFCAKHSEGVWGGGSAIPSEEALKYYQELEGNMVSCSSELLPTVMWNNDKITSDGTIKSAECFQ